MTMEFVLADSIEPSQFSYQSKVALARFVTADRAVPKEREVWRAMSEWERRHFCTIAREEARDG